MNTNEKIMKYRAEAEKFSGMYGDGDEGMSSFDYNAGEDQNYLNASGGAVREISQPYIISIQNTTTANLTATIFGWNDNTGSTNFGNNVGLVFVDVIRTSTFNRLFNQSQNAPFRIGGFRFSSTSSSQLLQTVTISYVDANGDQLNKVIPLSQKKSIFQYSTTDIDVDFPVTVDGNTSIAISVLASTTITIQMMPNARFTNKAALNGVGGIQNSQIPNINKTGASPVVIQTNSPVQRIG